MNESDGSYDIEVRRQRRQFGYLGNSELQIVHVGEKGPVPRVKFGDEFLDNEAATVAVAIAEAGGISLQHQTRHAPRNKVYSPTMPSWDAEYMSFTAFQMMRTSPFTFRMSNRLFRLDLTLRVGQGLANSTTREG